MKSEEVRKKFIEFWVSPPRKHKEIPNVSLVPESDSTLLFVNSGMFPLAPYLAGLPHPLGKRLCNIQRCLRTNYDEMIEVGDNRHTLMFEMLGNWSLGDYFKKEQIPWVFELYTDVFGVDPRRLYISVWAGDKLVPRDNEAIELWKKVFAEKGVPAEFSTDITQIPPDLKKGEKHKYRIFPYGREKNWWQRGEQEGELGGPTTELFYDTGKIVKKQKKYHINDNSGRFIELGNSVFMQYILNKKLKWERLNQKNVDFGGGLERLVMVVQDKDDIFETDIYKPIIEKIEEISGKNYKTNNRENKFTSSFRVIADHARAATFILGDGILPSNKDQGYILRRFIRRLVRFGKKLGINTVFTPKVAEAVIDRMKKIYPHLIDNKEIIFKQLEMEEVRFKKTLDRGLKEIEKAIKNREEINGKKAFYFYETFGFPLELTLDELKANKEKAEKIEKEFKTEENKHRQKSRAGICRKFKGGLADKKDINIKYHTATHLLLAALKKIANKDIHQKGSNITPERLRFDFNCQKPLSSSQIARIEKWVNDAIDKKLDVSVETTTKEEAKRKGAEATFWERYPEKVTVYKIWDPKTGKVYSYEICSGPHVKNTGELGKIGRFKIIKEESIGLGVRRIRAILG